MVISCTQEAETITETIPEIVICTIIETRDGHFDPNI